MYTNRLKLPLIHSGQAQKEITHNEALNMLDILVNPVVQEVNINSPPNLPKAGQLYIIGQNPTGEFAEYANKIAQRLENSWRFITPLKWLEITLDKDGSKYRFDGKTGNKSTFQLYPLRLCKLKMIILLKKIAANICKLCIWRKM
nr:DUF2793 domain-containing protein [Rickettsia endosymbiont of Ceutorhynchus assimilis]